MHDTSITEVMMEIPGY